MNLHSIYKNIREKEELAAKTVDKQCPPEKYYPRTGEICE